VRVLRGRLHARRPAWRHPPAAQRRAGGGRGHGCVCVRGGFCTGGRCGAAGTTQ
jgi:hypothetical protein